MAEDILPNQDCDLNVYLLEGRGISITNGDVTV